MAYTKYSLTPANNTATPPDGAPEGMLPSAVNDTMRDMMAQIRDCGDGIRDGTYTMTAAKITGGTITGITDLAIADGGTGASTAAGARTNLGLDGFVNMKNRIINGAMSFWQRGTSFTNPAVAGNFYTADRWSANRAGDVAGATVSQSTDVPSGFQYSLKLQRTAGNTSTAGLYLFNSNETVNTRDLAGQSVTISFWVKTGANYSGGALSVQGNWGTGTDQRVYAYTGSTVFINTTQAITSTWTRYSFTGSVGASSTEVGFQLFWTPTGTAGADDSIYITGVQLEVGSTATSFDYRPYGTELALCQRYYYRISPTASVRLLGQGQCFSTTAAGASIFFPVSMRTRPSSLEQTGTATDYSALTAAGGTQVCNAVPTFNGATTTDAAYFTVGFASGVVAGDATSILTNSSSSYLGWSAEL